MSEAIGVNEIIPFAINPEWHDEKERHTERRTKRTIKVKEKQTLSEKTSEPKSKCIYTKAIQKCLENSATQH